VVLASDTQPFATIVEGINSKIYSIERRQL
jgi:hypothetical protein